MSWLEQYAMLNAFTYNITGCLNDIAAWLGNVAWSKYVHCGIKRVKFTFEMHSRSYGILVLQ